MEITNRRRKDNQAGAGTQKKKKVGWEKKRKIGKSHTPKEKSESMQGKKGWENTSESKKAKKKTSWKEMCRNEMKIKSKKEKSSQNITGEGGQKSEDHQSDKRTKEKGHKKGKKKTRQSGRTKTVK